MAERLFKRLSFERGYFFDKYAEAMSPEGTASFLGNWVPSPQGGLKPRDRWFRGTQTGIAPLLCGSLAFSPLANPIGGIFTSEWIGTDLVIRRSSTPYSSPTWNLVDTLAGSAGGGNNRHVPFATGLNRVVYGNTSFPGDRLRIWDGAAAADASSEIVAGRTLAFHKERFFSGGPDWNSSALHFSGLGSATDWDVNRYIDVRSNNGGSIVDACVVNQGLLIAKTNSLHLLAGDGPGSFAVIDIMGGEGTAGRCIAATPYGAVIVGSSGVYLWDGGGAVTTLVPENDWIFFDASSIAQFPISCVYVNGVVYAMSRFQNACWAIDLERGVRWLEFSNTGSGADNDDVFHFDGLDYIAILASAGFNANYDNDVLIGAPITGATAPGVSYRNGLTGLTTDLNFPEDYRMQKDRVQLGTPAHPATLLHVHLLVRAGPNSGNDGLVLTVSDDVVGTPTKVVTILPANPSLTRHRLDIGLTAQQFTFELKNEMSALSQTSWEIEDVLLEYEIEDAR